MKIRQALTPTLFALAMLSAAAASAAQASKPQPRISDTYARKAMEAVNAIWFDAKLPIVSGGKVFTSSKPRDAVDAADIEASSDDEKRMNGVLAALALSKMTDNLRRAKTRNQLIIEYYRQHRLADQSDAEAYADSLFEQDAEVVEAREEEEACFGPLKENLRARVAEVPAACGILAPVVTPTVEVISLPAPIDKAKALWLELMKNRGWSLDSENGNALVFSSFAGNHADAALLGSHYSGLARYVLRATFAPAAAGTDLQMTGEITAEDHDGAVRSVPMPPARLCRFLHGDECGQ